MDELITELMKRVADEAAVPTIGAPYISRAARTRNRSGRSTCIITLKISKPHQGPMAGGHSASGGLSSINRVGSRVLAPDFWRPGVMNLTMNRNQGPAQCG